MADAADRTRAHRSATRALILALGVLLLTGAGPTWAAAPESGSDRPELAWTARLDGRAPDQLRGPDPLSIGTEDPLTVQLALRNAGAEPLLVKSLRLQGRAMGLVFFRYTIALDIELAPGQETDIDVAIDLDDLAGQAVGLLPADLMLVGEDRAVLGEEPLDVDVEGSLWSAYGLFGLAVAASTALLLVTLLVAVWRGNLHPNRWKRGLQFAAPGLGLGLTVTFTLSATGLLVPGAGAWLPIVAGFTAVAFVTGYLLPLGAGEAEPPPEDEAAAEAAGADRSP